MLVTFSCEEYETITMFGEVAKKLLTLMGHSATIPGALVAKEVPIALSHLKKGIEQEKQKSSNPANSQQDDEESEPPIGLPHRAIPLIAMLETASKHQCNVMWK